MYRELTLLEKCSCDSNKDLSFAAHTENEFKMPKQIYNQVATLVYQLTLVFKKNAHEIFDFNFENIVLEHQGASWMRYEYNSNLHACRHLIDYVSMGVPTNTYNSILKKSEQSTGLSISRNSLTEFDGYTWLFTYFEWVDSIKYCVYSEESDNIEEKGALKDALKTLKSNVIGTGHFNVSVMKSTIDNRYFLKFTMTKFQLINTTQKSSKSYIDKANVTKIEPAYCIKKLYSEQNE